MEGYHLSSKICKKNLEKKWLIYYAELFIKINGPHGGTIFGRRVFNFKLFNSKILKKKLWIRKSPDSSCAVVEQF